MIQIKSIIILVLLSIELSASPLWLAGLTNKIISFGKSAQEKTAQMKHFARMTALLSEIKLVNKKQNQDIQNIYLEYKKVTKGSYYKPVTELIYSNDNKDAYRSIQEMSQIQAIYTKNDWIAIKEKQSKKKTEELKNWLTTADKPASPHIESESVQKSIATDLENIDQLNQVGREQQNNKQNTDIIHLLNNINQKEKTQEEEILEKSRLKKEEEILLKEKQTLFENNSNAEASQGRLKNYKRWY